MARPANRDPLSKYHWAVTIDGFTRLGFSSCETPSLAINTQKYTEGGAHLWPLQIVDSVEYKPVTLQRGVTSDFNFHNWAIQCFEMQTNYPDKAFSSNTLRDRYTPMDYRKDVIIDHLDRAGRIVKRYVLHKAIPIEYKPASDFAADSDDVLSMEKLTLAYESFEVLMTNANKDNNPTDVKDIVKRLINRI